MFEVNFKEKNILLKQITNSQVCYEQVADYISIKFKTKCNDKFSYLVRVPIEMRAHQKNSAPIVFMLHVIDGLVDELEIFTADASLIHPNNIDLSNVEYVIDEEIKEE